MDSNLVHETVESWQEADNTYCWSAEIPQRYPRLFSRRRWEWLMRNRHQNGVDRAVRKVGRKYLIHMPTLFEVVEGWSEV